VGASDPRDLVGDDSGDLAADVGAVEREIDAMFPGRSRRLATRLPGELPCVT
jgi:hypothetical protein